MTTAIFFRSSDDAPEMLLKADARFLGDTRGIGIDSLEKTLDLILHGSSTRGGDFPRLDLVLHFSSHSRTSTETRKALPEPRLPLETRP
jgi:hypothetical protein